MQVCIVFALFLLATLIGVLLDGAHESIRTNRFTLLPKPLILGRAGYSVFIGGVNAPTACYWLEAVKMHAPGWEPYLTIFLIALLADSLLTALTDACYRAKPPQD